MADELDPPRRFFQLKAKDFQPVNAVPAAPAAPIQPDPGVMAAPLDVKIDVRDNFRDAGQAGPVLRASATKSAPNEVRDILRDNHVREDAAGLFVVAPRVRRPSRRRRDFILLAVSGNGLILLALTWVPILARVGLIVFNTALIWVMWFVMDDY